MNVGKGLASRMNRRIRIERPEAASGFASAGKSGWALFAEAWAEVQDVLPSRAERIADGISIATRPARVRLAYRPDITPDMRFVMDDRIMQIVAGPAELGFREAVEFMVADYSTAGTGA